MILLSLSLVYCGPNRTAFSTIVLNFNTYIGSQFFPNLLCLNITDPFESSLINKAIIKNNGDSKITPIKDNIVSTTLFPNFLYNIIYVSF